ncbi:DUF5050 domain-containing protein [Clostridium ganghwense]|uniref:DUF5050 domain-containing protein n=1 Tax=Clostridium ganghwense TaxID=312089 RepID=A0ABT4CQ37_9CLOT|nr:DUF5050 domain-containing protein [Clostridium ganghwense]MCY6371165.1 DUF5050 domain-containing protein [Clostridium ganghwense]
MTKRKLLIITTLLMFSSLTFSGCKNAVEEKAVAVENSRKKIVNTYSNNSNKNDEKSNINKNSKENSNVTIKGNEKGNTAGNLNNFGFAAKKGDWIYYLHEEDGKRYLYKKKIDGSSKIKLTDDTPFYINVVGDYIYYNNTSDNNNIYRIKTDGTGREKISEDEVQEIYVEGNNIYYINLEDWKLYRLSIDKKEKVKLSDDTIEVGGIASDEEWIYYTNKGIHKIKKDGSDKTVVAEENSDFISLIGIEGDWIYYLNESGIFKIKKDKSSKENIFSGIAAWGNLDKEHIYFSDINNGCICKIDKDGKNKVKVVDDFAYKINVVGDSIYYDYSNRPIKLKWDKINK